MTSLIALIAFVVFYPGSLIGLIILSRRSAHHHTLPHDNKPADKQDN